METLAKSIELFLCVQVILGSYPIAQTREPYSVVQFLAERLDLPRLLRLHSENDKKWTTYDLCEAWAEKRGYMTARSNRPDIARASNHIMRMALEGRLTLCLRPPGFESDKWKESPDIDLIKSLLAMEKVQEAFEEGVEEFEDSTEESDDSEGDQEGDEPPISVAKNKFSALNVD